jgi:hypothetical protein
MQLRQFVTICSVILSGWLVLTFVSEVPAKGYPKLQKHGRAISSPASKGARLVFAEPEQGFFRVSVSQ